MARFICRSVCPLLLIAIFGNAVKAQRTIHIPVDFSTIQAGIDAASNGDTVLVSPGIYYENVDFKGKAILVTSGATDSIDAMATIIQGSAGPTVTFRTGESISSELNGFTIEHPQLNGSDTVLGEGVYVSGASPKISNNVITANTGCGVAVLNSSSPVIIGNYIGKNLYSSTVAGISCGGPDVPDVLTPGVGIALQNDENVQIVGNLIERNQSDNCGGGISALDTQNVLIENNIIRNNLAACTGGVFASSVGNISLVQNLIYNNIAQAIGGIAGHGSGIQISVDNILDPFGGTESIVNNTVFGNKTISSNGTDQDAAGDQLYLNFEPAQSAIENNIFESADGSQAVYCVFGAEYNFSYNDVLNAGTYVPPDCGGGTANIFADPLFVNVSSGNFHLTANSPAIAAGTTTAANLPATDLDGLSRTYNGSVGMGVYEYHPPTFDTTSLTSSVNPSLLGQSVVFTATVIPAQSSGPITGTVAFTNGAKTLAIVNVSPAGVAIFSTSTLSVGTHSITAAYSGDINQKPSTSNTVDQVVTLIGTSIALSTSSNPAAFGTDIRFTANVSSPDANGAMGLVSFYDGSTLLSSVSLGGGSAIYTTSTLAVGAHTIKASFAGGGNFSPSNSNTIDEEITSDFAIIISPNSRTIYPGDVASATVTLKPNTGFTLPVALSCSNLPDYTTCAFSPNSISGNGSSSFTIRTASPHQVSSLNHSHVLPWRCLGVLALSGCFIWVPRRFRHYRRSLRILLFVGCGLVQACGSPGPIVGGTPPGTYTITVTGTSAIGGGTLKRSAKLTLRVKSYF